MVTAVSSARIQSWATGAALGWLTLACLATPVRAEPPAGLAQPDRAFSPNTALLGTSSAGTTPPIGYPLVPEASPPDGDKQAD